VKQKTSTSARVPKGRLQDAFCFVCQLCSIALPDFAQVVTTRQPYDTLGKVGDGLDYDGQSSF
jgi:hypothetical protein